MLEVGPPGNGLLSLDQQQAHFALWALVKSPLTIGADLRCAVSEHRACGACMLVPVLGRGTCGGSDGMLLVAVHAGMLGS